MLGVQVVSIPKPHKGALSRSSRAAYCSKIPRLIAVQYAVHWTSAKGTCRVAFNANSTRLSPHSVLAFGWLASLPTLSENSRTYYRLRFPQVSGAILNFTGHFAKQWECVRWTISAMAGDRRER